VWWTAAEMVVGGGVDGNPMVTAPSFEEDHSNHINSYVGNIVVSSFF